MPVSISDLLPYDVGTKKDGQMAVGLKEHALLVNAMGRAVESIEKGNFEAFDALVGENMCHIRAGKVAQIAKGLLERVPLLKTEIALVQGRIKAAEQAMGKSPKGTLKDVIEERDLDVTLMADEALLLRAYLLTVVKEVKPPKVETPFLANEATAPKKLQTLGAVSSNFTNALVKKMREDLSGATVNFIRDCADKLPERDALLPLVADGMVVRQNGCVSLPFFFGSDILLRQMATSNIPIVVNIEQRAADAGNRCVRQISLLFKVDDRGSYQRKSIPATEEFGAAVVVFNGVMQRPSDKMPTTEETAKAVEGSGVTDIILMNSADHRQAPDPAKDALIADAGGPRLAGFKARTAQEGCALQNPSLFLINHSFCSTIGRQPVRKMADINAHFAIPAIAELIAAYEE